jgi:rfaE bifunctional protein kinase chain/domain
LNVIPGSVFIHRICTVTAETDPPKTAWKQSCVLQIKRNPGSKKNEVLMFLNSEQVEEIIEEIRSVRVAVCGDYCLDAYWIMDPRGSEVSVETGLRAEAAARHYYSPGGASNIAANLAALNPGSIRAIGVIGDDIFGRELQQQLGALNVDISGLVIQKQKFDTVTFTKKYLNDREAPRVDFGVFNRRSKATDEKVLALVRESLEQCDVLIFNQQVPNSLNREPFIDGINDLFKAFDDKIVLFDSRHYGDRFAGVYRKANDIEVTRLCGVDAKSDDVITLADLKGYAQKIYSESQKPLFITRGARGILVIDDSGINQIPGIQLLKKLDTVGAGDTTISALALCLATGRKPVQAASFANFAASVTVQKLFTTGTANGDEILAMSRDPDYIFQPELAEDRRQAVYVNDSEIEICDGGILAEMGDIRHAVFDHDGTISTLRQGWESIMEPVMIRAILGDRYETADETLYHKVRNRVVDFIDKSTGVQTIVQMEGLVEMVGEFGIVSQKEIRDKFGYKEVFNQTLMNMVNGRIEKIGRGELDVADFTIKGAVEFLQELKRRRVKLYLASGTDQADVVAEAEVLGYANLFDGGVYGSVGDISKYSKKMVIEKIIRDCDLKGTELVVFGDGPVEMREARKCGGFAVGISSDEIRRYGLNSEKRSRLIKGGAQIIVADFSQGAGLLSLLFPGR